MDIRLKWLGTASQLPGHDVNAAVMDSPLLDHSGDVRLMFSGGGQRLSWIAHHATTFVAGDSAQLAQAGGTLLDQTPRGDQRRLADLTGRIDDGDRHDAFHRLDRLALKYRGDMWSLTLGREAVSWGSGRVFQPMDLFNPFAPTVVDRDYKAGDDLIHFQRLFDNGSDLELLAVGRRDEDQQVTGQAASVAAKLHGFWGLLEYEVMAAKHYRDQVLGVSMRVPVGGALIRADVVANRLADGGTRTSGILNVDYSFELNGKSVYLFGEYFHNGFGLDELDPTAPLNDALVARLRRGEVFSLMKDYTAVGGNIQWHALLTQSMTVLTNLHDGSSLLQTSFVYDPGDRQRVEVGLTLPMGRAGDEYGGVPVGVSPEGNVLTSGGGARGYVRWVFYL